MKTMFACLRFSVLIAVLFFPFHVLSQAPSTGFEISSILVDGCDGGNEGKNEMVSFQNGPVALDMNDIRVDGAPATGVIATGKWPSGSNFLGWCTDPAATTKIATLNDAIVKCGKLLEPPAGVVPPGGKVLIITSTDFTATLSYFMNLTDTLYVVLQCAGNTSGHFANYNNPPTPSYRTLVLTNTVTGYADTVIYNKSALVTTAGTIGNQDGGAVSYDWDGNATYFNNGCEAPFIPISTSIAPVANADCTTNTFSFSGSVLSGSYKKLIWEGGTGVYTTPNALTTDYTPGVGELGTVTITFMAIDYCDDTTTTTVDITVYPLPVADAGTDIVMCSGDTEPLGVLTTAGFSYSWAATTGLSSAIVSDPTVTLSNLTALPVTTTYTVTTTVDATMCAATNDVDVTVNPLDISTFTTTPSCTGGTASITGLAGGTFSFAIPLPSDGAVINTSTGEVTNGVYGTSYAIEYTTNGTCSTTTPVNLVVLTQDDASFTTVPTCTGGTMNITGLAGGTFSFAIPVPSDGAVINASTGEVTNGVYGTTYAIEYTTNGTCPNTTTENLVVLNQDNADFTMTATCGGGTASISGLAGGTFTFTNPAPVDGAVINAATGVVSNGLPSTTYFVTYATPVSACTNTSSTSVQSLALDDASFTTTPWCDGGSMNLSSSAVPGGIFTFSSGPAVGDPATIDPTTGLISNGVSGTTYNITYTTPLSGCTNSYQNSVTASFSPDDASFTLVPSCTGATAIVNGTPGGTFSFTSIPTDGATIDPLSGTISNGISGATYNVTYETGGVCSASLNKSVVVSSPDDASFTTTPNCTGGTVTLQGTTGGIFTFTSSPSDLAVIDASSGTVSNGTSGFTYPITYSTSSNCPATVYGSVKASNPPSLAGKSDSLELCTMDILSEIVISPSMNGTITWFSDSTLNDTIATGNTYMPTLAEGTNEFYFTETAGACTSSPERYTIQYDRCDVNFPTAITPDGDGINDTWELTDIDIDFPENTVRIYDRWGALIFESSKGSYSKKEWDGTYKGNALPVSAYYFIIEYDLQGTTATGTVSILMP